MAFDKNKYDNQYKRDNYDRVGLMLPKGTLQQIKDYAQSHGMSVNAMIIDALEAHYGFDLSKQ